MRKHNFSKQPVAWISIALLLMAAMLVGLRAALPIWLHHRVNRPPAEHARYRWQVEDVDVHILSRSYEFEGVTLRKRGLSSPIFTAERVRSTFNPANPFTSPITVDLEAFHPKLEIDLAADGRAPSEKPPDWEKILRKLTLRRVSGITLHEGEIHFHDYESRPEVELSAEGVSVRADYLYRVGKDSSHWADLEAEGRFMGSGRFKLKTRLDPEAARPAFAFDFTLHGLELNTINPALMAYAGMEVEKGVLDLEVRATASGGRYRGRIRSGLEDFEMAESRPKDEGLVKALTRKVSGVLGKVLEKKTDINESQGKGLPKADFSGEFPKEVEDAWSMSEFLLKESFRKGLKP